MKATAFIFAGGWQTIEHISVSTDSAENTAFARAYGTNVPFTRMAELARNKSSE